VLFIYLSGLHVLVLLQDAAGLTRHALAQEISDHGTLWSNIFHIIFRKGGEITVDSVEKDQPVVIYEGIPR